MRAATIAFLVLSALAAASPAAAQNTSTGTQQAPAAASPPAPLTSPAPSASSAVPMAASPVPAASQSAPATPHDPSSVAPTPDRPVEALPPVTNAPAIQTDGTGSSGRADQRLPHDLSPWSMFLAADILVKAVMLGLLFASIVTWTIFLGKTVELGLARRRLKNGLARTEEATSFAEAEMALGKGDAVIGSFVAVAAREMDLAIYASQDAGVKERAESRLAELVRTEVQSMRRGMGLLATIGSTAPFVGLFGTVWGIMNAFIGISKAQTTNLAVVAPGIAEALLATAIGLVAAIPAVIIYNHFSQATRRYQFLVGRASGTVQRLLSRELDRRQLGEAMRGGTYRAAE